MAVIAASLAIPPALGLEPFPPSLAGNHSDPNPHVPPVLSPEPQTPRPPGPPWGSSCGPAAPGIWCLVSAVLLSSYHSILRPGCVPAVRLLWHTGRAQWLLPSCPLWLRGMWQRGPTAAGAAGVSGSTGGCRRDLPITAWAGAAGPALHNWREALGNPAGWLKNCASVLGLVCLFALGVLLIWGFSMCCGVFV